MARAIRGWEPGEEQVANAHDDFVDLTPVSQQPYLDTLAKWRALMGIGAHDGNDQDDVLADDEVQ